MNREIKFRAKALSGEDWLYGLLNESIQTMSVDGITSKLRIGRRFVNTETVGQFTGLLDNNGKEIYEGDIIQSFDSNGKPIRHIVEYERTEAKFVAILAERPKYDFGGDISQRWIKEFEKEVIGNIYDNPELLNK